MTTIEPDVRGFLSPFEVPVPPGCEGWESMYPYYALFSEERRESEESRGWFRDGMHFPEPMFPFDFVTADSPYMCLGQANSRIFCVPPALGIDHRVLYGWVYMSANGVTDPAEIGRRAQLFGRRAGFYFQNWDALYARWRGKVEETIDELASLEVPDLPEIEDQAAASGFVMNHCSHWTRFYSHAAYRDFSLHNEGLRYLFPEENEGMIFDDGSSFIGLSAWRVVDTETGRQERSEENIARTREQIARFSERDAVELLEVYEQHWKQAFRRHRFSTPPPWGTPDPLEELLEVPGTRIAPVHQFMTLRQLAQDFFDSPELQILFMRAATTSTGCFPDDVPGLQGLIHCLPLTLSFEPAAIAVGGSQAITDALVAAGRKLGADYATSSEVDRITVSGNRATGVELTDGSRISAALVVSNLGLPNTVLRLLRNEQVDERLRRRIRNIHFDRGQLLWANLALHESPRYLAERENPGVGAQPRLYWGPKDLDYLNLAYQSEIFLRGFGRRPYVLCSVDSLWDGSRAPAGRHIVGVEEFSAPRRRFSPAEWRAVKQRFVENLLREWANYAPNMTEENVIAARIYSPEDIQRERPNMIEGGYSTGSTIASQLGRFRPIPDLTGHRVLLENLYDCSANLHSGSGIGRGSSYNCYREIAQALRLEQPAAA